MHLVIIEPITWIIIAAFNLLTMIINAFILQKELKSIKTKQNIFTTKYLKIYSTACIICGVLYALFSFLQPFNVFCYVSSQFATQAIQIQGLFIGLYQLERLHYTFAESQVYSNNGYSKCLFFIMYTYGILAALYALIYPWFYGHITACGINKHYQYFAKYSTFNSLYGSMISIAGIVYILWDGTTLFLYMFKVISFRHYKSINIDIYNRIMSILNRILILTITYEIMFIVLIVMLVIIASIADMFTIHAFLNMAMNIVTSFVSIVWSFSMYLMQQHNTDKYNKFLQIIYKFKCHYICCCCCISIIDYEMEMYSDTKKLEIDINKQEKQTKDNDEKQDDDTIWETRDISTKIEQIKVDPFELSIETTAQK